tara:strand:+ start:192 stop:914 length:723 start_codon:yes stop_codon:yes gene_type:complete
MTDNFWYNNINVLYDKDNILEIIPLRKYNFNRKLNSLVRLSILYSIISYLIKNNINVICIPFIVIIITVFLYKNNNKNNNKNTKYENLFNKANIDKLVNTKLLNNDILEQSNLLNTVLPSSNDKYAEFNINQIPIVNKIINNSSCTKPTKDNPFMNLNNYELSTGPKPDSCSSYNNLKIQNMIDNIFNDDVYIDSDDLFNRKSSQRQFYTVPNNLVPNNQTDFANSLYNIGDRDRNKFYI